MTVLVTAATGQLGRLVVRSLLEKTPADQIVAGVRSPERAADLAALGVEVRPADHSRPDTLKTAFEGVDRLLLISGPHPGVRIAQHQAVIDAAKEAGVGLLAYTSLLGADTATIALADDHQATEEAVRASGVPFALLRNGWYTEMYTGQTATYLQHGAILASCGEGRIASAERRDYAEAAAAVLTGQGHENTVYELSGDRAWGMADLAAEIAGQSGRPVAYRPVSPQDHAGILREAGLPAPLVDILVDADAGISRGELSATPGDLSRLIGRPTTPLADSVRTALSQH